MTPIRSVGIVGAGTMGSGIAQACAVVGLDVMLAVMNVFWESFNDPKYRPAPLLREMVDAGYLGRKARRGFYTYG